MSKAAEENDTNGGELPPLHATPGSASLTPETDAVLAMEDRGSGWLVAGRLEEHARKLERERNTTIEALKEMLHVVDERCGGRAEGTSRLARACETARGVLSQNAELRDGGTTTDNKD